MTTKRCDCDCDCGCRATTTDDCGNHCCDECASYYLDDGGQPVCSRVADGTTCHVCREPIDWSVIIVGGPGGGMHRDGTCGCAGRAWSDEERGGDWQIRTGMIGDGDDV